MESRKRDFSKKELKNIAELCRIIWLWQAKTEGKLLGRELGFRRGLLKDMKLCMGKEQFDYMAKIADESFAYTLPRPPIDWSKVED